MDIIVITYGLFLNTLFLSADKTYAFYIHGAEEQICSGYLYKSPPENLFKSQVCFSKGAEQVLLSINGRLPLPISLMLYIFFSRNLGNGGFLFF